MKKILFICPYPPGLAPSQRFRFEQYIRQLQEMGFDTVIRPFFSESSYVAFYQSGNLLSKIHAIVESYWRRLALLLHLSSVDFIFIHREVSPAGPPFFEWWFAKVRKKNIIYDFDDAIWTTDNTDEPRLLNLLRWRRKVASICRWSYRISCGNEFLAAFARRYNSDVVVLPTTIDAERVHVPKSFSKTKGDRITIGWTGSHSTLKYLNIIVPVLRALEEEYPFIETLVIADRNPKLQLKRFRFLPWNRESEVSDLAQIDIGVMPLSDDEWTRGKCGFKALQYMALRIPAVVSPVGANLKIVEHGKEGFQCDSYSEWYNCLATLIKNPELRAAMGQRGRQKVIDCYSVMANSERFLSLFQ